MNNSFKKNSLTLFRYLAAFQVLINHAVHLNLPFPWWIKWVWIFQGVPLFFGMSGFLIWKSLEREQIAEDFFRKRFLRLYPEMWMSIALSVLTIIILYNNQIAWAKMPIYIFTQATVFQFWTPDFLRGYGIGTPNGSLWTIPVFVQFYLFIYLVYKKLQQFSIMQWGILFGLALVLNITCPVGDDSIVYKLYRQTLFPYLYLFLIGCFLSKYYEMAIPFLKKTWIVFLILDIACLAWGVDLPGRFGALRTTSLVIATIGLSYWLQIRISVDLSYEFYIFHMIVLNVFVHTGNIGSYSSFIEVIIVTFVIAILAYHAQKIIVKRFGVE